MYRLDQVLEFLYKKKQIPSERLCRAIRMFEIQIEEIGRILNIHASGERLMTFS